MHISEVAISRRREVIVGTIMAYANSGVSAISGLLLIPVYLGHMSLQAYGAWLASGNVIGLLMLLDSGLNVILLQALSAAAGRNDGAAFHRCKEAGAVLLAGAAVLVLFIGNLIATPIAHATAGGADISEVGTAFRLAVAGAGCSLVSWVYLSMLQSLGRVGAAGAAILSGNLVGLAVTYVGLRLGWGVVALGAGASARGLVGLAVAFCATHWLSCAGKLKSGSRADLRDVYDLGRKGGALFVSRLASGVAGNTEALIVNIWISADAAVMLSVSQKLYQVVVMLVSPMYASAFAGLARLSSSASAADLDAAVSFTDTVVVAATGFAFGVAVCMNEDLVRNWIGETKFGGSALNIILCLSFVLSCRSSAIANLVNAVGVIGPTAWGAVGDVTLRLATCAILMPYIGIYALPVGALTGGALTIAVFSVLLKRRLGDGYGKWLVPNCFLVSYPVIAGVLLALVLQSVSGWLAFAGKGMICAVLVGTLALAGSAVRDAVCRAFRGLSR
jgi:O-antigen/teichoic acid export membrane protein